MNKLKEIIAADEKLLGYKAYRYVDTLYFTGDEDSGYRAYVNIRLIAFDVVKETLKGIWIRDIIGKCRFVNLHARKKYACISKSGALESFIRRKQSQIRILKTQLMHAENALQQAKRIVVK